MTSQPQKSIFHPIMSFNEFINNSLEPQTFWVAAAVIVALFWDKTWSLITWFFLKKPKLSILFDKNSERCYRTATLVGDAIQGHSTVINVDRQYFRLRIRNNGGFAQKIKVRADLLSPLLDELDRFEPTTLRWINNREENDLARGEVSYINLLSQIINNPRITERLRVEVFDKTPRGIGWDRPLDEYIIKIIVHGENISPITEYFRFIPPTFNIQAGELEKTSIKMIYFAILQSKIRNQSEIIKKQIIKFLKKSVKFFKKILKKRS